MKKHIVSIPVWCNWRTSTNQQVANLQTFQFQYGAIDGVILSRSFVNVLMFQFQYGAIDGPWKAKNANIAASFNSSMVQLTEKHRKTI